MFSLGPLNLSMPFMLAPLSGVSDLPFRLIAREFGCPLAFTEMINARALAMRNSQTLSLLQSSAPDSPLGVQLLGHEPDAFLQALDVLASHPHDVLDVNAACPVHKVVRKGEGAALMRTPETLERIVAVLVRRSLVPVTVKIRAGWDRLSVNAPEIARRVEAAGASALCIHGRTRDQAYRGSADASVIKAVKEAVSIPVFASGDLFSPQAALGVMEETGCDGAMIARGALGNPWIFRDLAGLSETSDSAASREPRVSPDLAEVQSVMEKHLNLSVWRHGPEVGVIAFRKCFIWYTKGLRNARAMRTRAVQASCLEEMKALIDELSLALPAEEPPHLSRASW